MTLDEFWANIHATKHERTDTHLDNLEKYLTKLPPDEILDFAHWWGLLMREAYHWALSGAHYLITRSHSDDGFCYFRDWLVLQGRDVFHAAVADPDTLVAVIGPDHGRYSGENYVAADAWVAASGADPDYSHEAFYDALEARHPTRRRTALGSAPDEDERWDHDDAAEMRLRLPRLSARCLQPEAPK